MKPQITGGLTLDASILDEQDAFRIALEDIKENRIEFHFPSGLNQVDLFDECRALTKLDDFETMFDLTMSMLHGKMVIINIKHDDGTKRELARFQVVDRYMNLRSVPVLDSYPILVTWLTEFIGVAISKKFPEPTKPQTQAQEETKRQKKQKTKTAQSDT